MAAALFGSMHAIDFSASGDIDLTVNSGAGRASTILGRSPEFIYRRPSRRDNLAKRRG
jgi:hypothetical protein